MTQFFILMFTLRNLKIQIENPENKTGKNLLTENNFDKKNNFDKNKYKIKYPFKNASQLKQKINIINNNNNNNKNNINKNIKNKSFSLHNLTTRNINNNNNNNNNRTYLYTKNETIKNLIIKEKKPLIINQKFNIPKGFKKNKNLTRNLTRINSKENIKNKTKNNSTLFIKNIQQIKNNNNNYKKINEKINITKYYCNKESEKIILKRGEDFYKFVKKNCKLKYNSSFLSKKLISEKIYLKMIDWMIEVLSAFHCSDETFFLSVHLMNSFINKETNYLKDENIHLIGIISMFISSKFEDKFPINFESIYENVAKKNYTKEKILNFEKHFFKIILNDFFFISTFDFIKLMFFDFKISNNKLIYEKNLNVFINNLFDICKFLCKLIYHFHYFYNFDECSKSIAILMSGLSILKTKNKKLKFEHEEIFFEWIIYIINENEKKYNIEYLNDLNLKIIDCYESYFSLQNQIKLNLNKFCEIKFD